VPSPREVVFSLGDTAYLFIGGSGPTGTGRARVAWPARTSTSRARPRRAGTPSRGHFGDLLGRETALAESKVPVIGAVLLLL
jgi:hypothetical protein